MSRVRASRPMGISLGFRTTLALLVAASSFVVPAAIAPSSVPAASAATTTWYFHGVAQDQVNKVNGTPTATFNTTAPTGATSVNQTTSWIADPTVEGDPTAAFWSAPFTGSFGGVLRIDWWWSTTNPEAVVISDQIDVTVFADGNAVATLTEGLSNITATPTRYSALIEIPQTTVATGLTIQAAGHFSDSSNGLLVHYDSTATPSAFSFITVPPDEGSLAFDAKDTVAFAPSTVVSAHWLGAEPQLTMERKIAASKAGAVNPNRIFVDWPLSTRAQTGQLSRSLDGGDSYRLLFDPTCATRSRPNCGTGGGGDTEETVNLANGHLFFADQEALANEALASSTNHGDSWPSGREKTLTNVALATDRQWLDPTNGLPLTISGKKIEAFLAYHGGPVTTVGQYVQAIDEDGNIVAQPGVGQIPGVAQSGPIRVDATNGPGRGWIYQSFYNGSTGVKVATVKADLYQDRFAWVTNDVSPKIPKLMPWLQLDNAGNAYATWATDGIAWLSLSPIADPRNDPTKGGRPGTFWTKALRVSAPDIKSAVFVMNVAGSAGRVAVAYLGSADCDTGAAATVVSDSCQLEAHWKTYVSVIDDALQLAQGRTAHVHTGVVSHRVAHRGSVCTGGTTCTGDRSLLDLIDLGFDQAGRIGVVTMDNNNRLAAPNLTDNAKSGPFSLFSKQVSGPSLLASKPTVSIKPALNSSTDPGGDATWPNTAAGTNLPSFDLKGARIFTDGTDVIASVSLANATKGRMIADLAAYNAAFSTDLTADRIQYVVRFASGDDVFHMSMDSLANGSRRFFGGRLDANDAITNGAGSTVGSRYVSDSGYPVGGFVKDGTLYLRAPLTAFGLANGARVYSVTAFATAGPLEDDATSTVMQNPARTVDATPPFDARLKAGAMANTRVLCDNDNLRRVGGWQYIPDRRASNGTGYCRAVVQDHSATMTLHYVGRAVDILLVKGPRGSKLTASIDGGAPTNVDLYRAASDPAHPDRTGRKDLTFGQTLRMEASAWGEHVLTVTAPKSTRTGRDMAY
ncbi:MAG: hypothetical protein QOH61_1606, partial [Chloroflexota bacterium]|nr:hypothetical protein [Chloroflexota bacterium]